MIVNFGCGYDLHDDAVNVDEWARPNDGVIDFRDLIVKVNETDDLVTEVRMFHVIEHLYGPLRVLERLWDLMAPDGKVIIKCPYGTSRDAWENPTHRRPYFYSSFGVFSQLYWWREDTDYKGDFQVEEVYLAINPEVWKQCTYYDGLDMNELQIDLDAVMERVKHDNDVVVEMTAMLRAVKPARVVEKGTKPEFPTMTIQVGEAIYE